MGADNSRARDLSADLVMRVHKDEEGQYKEVVSSSSIPVGGLYSFYRV